MCLKEMKKEDIKKVDVDDNETTSEEKEDTAPQQDDTVETTTIEYATQDDIDAVRNDIKSLASLLESIQSVVLENGARIVDSDVDIDGNTTTEDGFYSLDSLNLDLD